MLHKEQERGFVLITTLVVLMILTIMAIGLYFRSAVNQQTSVSDRDATKAYYMAETALNYMAWALHSDPDNAATDNDANLDGDTAPATGDRTELVDPNMGPTAVGYFDTSAPAGRAINFSDANNPPPLTLSTLAAPAHVTLNITTNDAANSVSITPAWSGGTGTPTKDGAIAWLTAAVLDEANPANEIDADASAKQYAIYAYAIGYVNKTPMRILRAKIGKMQANISDLGSMTNGNQ